MLSACSNTQLNPDSCLANNWVLCGLPWSALPTTLAKVAKATAFMLSV